jgi:hypothetical protein
VKDGPVTIIQPITTGDLTPNQIQTLCQNGLTVSVTTLTSGPSQTESRVDTAFAIPAMIAFARREEKLGAQALVIDCMALTRLLQEGPFENTIMARALSEPVLLYQPTVRPGQDGTNSRGRGAVRLAGIGTRQLTRKHP